MWQSQVSLTGQALPPFTHRTTSHLDDHRESRRLGRREAPTLDTHQSASRRARYPPAPEVVRSEYVHAACLGALGASSPRNLKAAHGQGEPESLDSPDTDLRRHEAMRIDRIEPQPFDPESTSDLVRRLSVGRFCGLWVRFRCCNLSSPSDWPGPSPSRRVSHSTNRTPRHKRSGRL
jgi:hypothetical protein